MSFSVAMSKSPSRKAPSPDKPMASITPYGLRMPRDLKDALEDEARANGRSLNSEIVARLQASVRDGGQSGNLSFIHTVKSAAAKAGPGDPVLEARVSELEKAVKALQQLRS